MFAEFDAERLRTGGLEEFFHRFYTDDLVIEHCDAFPVPGTYRGIEGYRDWLDEALGPYEDVRWDMRSVEMDGDRVVAVVRTHARLREEGLELEVGLRCVYDMRDGRAWRVRVYVSP